MSAADICWAQRVSKQAIWVRQSSTLQLYHLASFSNSKMRVRCRPPISTAASLPNRREKYFGSAGGALAGSAKHAASHAAGSSNSPGEAAANSSSAANCSIPGQGEQPAAVAGKSEPAVRYFVMGCRCLPIFVNQ